MNTLRAIFSGALGGTLALALWAAPAHSQSIVIDQEFDDACDTLAEPLKATLAPNLAFHCVLVVDDTINAFVTADNLIYLHSGLIRRAQNVAELQGVIAHELGHLAAGHLNQRTDQAQRSLGLSLAGAVLGMGAAIAGVPQAGVALMMGGQAAGISQFLAYSRTQEAEADRLAINALHQAGYSASGMVGLMSTLRTDSQLSYDTPPPYLVTHPLPPARLTTLQQAVAAEKGKTSPTTRLDFERLQAKVAGLSWQPTQVLRTYNQTTPPSHRYARALAYGRQGRLDDAESALAPLLVNHPNDPYYSELAAQFAVQRGNFGAANQRLTKLVQSNPNALLWRYQLAEVLRNQAQPAQAVPHYRAITRLWPIWDAPWTGLSLVYGQLDHLAESHLARAEAALAQNRPEAARQSLALAENYLKTNPNPEVESWRATLAARLQKTPKPRP